MDTSLIKFSFQFLTITIPIIAVIIGYYSSKRIEILRENRKLKADLFLQYIQISNKIELDKNNSENNIKYSETVEKLCLYANENVLIKIEQLHKGDKNVKNFTKTPDGKRIYSELVLAMRQDIGIKVKKLDEKIINNVLELDT